MSMRGVRAFTIVEFVIAIAIASIIGASAIARYNTYLREQSFEAGGTQIANCLSRASTLSRSSGSSPVRFTRATISYDSVEPRVDCIVESFGSLRTDGTVATTSQLLQGNPAEAATNQVYRAEFTSLGGSTTVMRVVFGSLENGMALGLSTNGLLVLQPDDSSNAVTYLPFGRGFSITPTLNPIRLNSATTNLCGTVTMTNLVTPVRFELLPACS